MLSNKTEGVSIERLSDKENLELPMGDFLKLLIAELPIADKVNDEIKLKNGEVFRISSLQVIEMDEPEEKDKETNNTNSSNFP